MLTKFIALFAAVGLLVQAASVKPIRPAVSLFPLLRAGDVAGVRAAIAAGADVHARDPEGATPLMYAALYADAAAVRLLLEQGARPNDANGAGVTALIWGTGSLDKVKLLVAHGADVQARSKLGKSALLVAASRDGAGPVVEYLLQHGARIDEKDDLTGVPVIPFGGGGTTAVMQAAKARDGEALRLLLKRGAAADAKEKNGGTALHAAIASRNQANVRQLLDRGADVNAATASGITPLLLAAVRDDLKVAQWLLAAGAKVDDADQWGNTSLMWAAFSEQARPEMVKMLLAAGADKDHKNKMGETALAWAQRRGMTSIVALLQPEGTTAPAAAKPVLTTAAAGVPRDLFQAVEQSLPLLQKSGPPVFKKGGCASCHNNMLPAMAGALARRHGHQVDDAALERERKTLLGMLGPARELLVENGDNLPDIPVTGPYALLTLQAQGHQPDSVTDALTLNLANKQNSDGSWTNWAPRPPMEYGDLQATVLSMRALQLYGPEGRRAEFAARVRKTGKWLAQATPTNTEEEAWQLLGLTWSKADPQAIAQAKQRVLAHQRPDGGWGQLPGLPTDAYATGQTLWALREASVLHGDQAAWMRGIDYLLRTQQPDGTWHVKSRSFPFQPYFESGFPYGPDQWISAAGSSWATIALTMAEQDRAQPLRKAAD